MADESIARDGAGATQGRVPVRVVHETPLSALLTGQLGSVAPDTMTNMAVGVELLHAASLVHDDVVDESHMRRGKKTANDAWGNAPSVLVGDFLYSRSFQMMVGLRNIWTSTERVAEGWWDRQTLIFREVAGKMLGLVGFGMIAREVAKRARALGMRVAAYDPNLLPGDPAAAMLGVLASDTALQHTASPTISGTIWLGESISGRPAALNIALSRPALACCAVPICLRRLTIPLSCRLTRARMPGSSIRLRKISGCKPISRTCGTPATI